MRLILLLICFSPFICIGQNDNNIQKSYTDNEVLQFVNIIHNHVNRPLSDDEIIQMVKESGLTIEEYKEILSRNNFGLDARTKTEPVTAKELSLAKLVAAKNIEKDKENELALASLCTKNNMTTEQYYAFKAAVESDQILKTRVIEVLKKL